MRRLRVKSPGNNIIWSTAYSKSSPGKVELSERIRSSCFCEPYICYFLEAYLIEKEFYSDKPTLLPKVLLLIN
ncbi:hypothetical protein A2686_04780 [Candidatus Woesebacteria bacterium RIFCSPHIGHO2_01_FULL_38_10]|nr:MAG: hypothetical protein A2686_04780 [Candidatus Woesebacteria bacterium RIFCSPHIGHO2_01_FULL_38_10]